MSVLVFLIFAVMTAGAIAAVVWPLLRARGEVARGRALLGAALGVFVIAIGAGIYAVLGQPALAVRAFEGTETRDLNGLVALLARQMRDHPDDARGWTMLGNAYLSAGDAQDAAKALGRAIALRKNPDGELLSAYGEALVRANGGVVTAEAEAAFNAALAADPKDRAARYFLGFAAVARGDKAGALAQWQSLLADAPPNAPYRAELVDRVAALSAATGSAPDIAAMVAGLAARLKADPDDAAGWQRLVKAYAVLGRRGAAKAALKDARSALASDRDAQAALQAEAKTLKLE
jgi:cytochrome c-type biogenesis protein CcmH